jgi:hypothetical protein
VKIYFTITLGFSDAWSGDINIDYIFAQTDITLYEGKERIKIVLFYSKI